MINEIKITYVYHSCFCVEIGDYFLVFDYYTGSLNIPEDKQVIFIATHGHSDHYTSEILKVSNMKDNIYILSKDIGKLERSNNIIYLDNDKYKMDYLKTLYNSENVHFVSKDQYLEIDLKDGKKISIKTFGSTDLGISVLVYIAGSSIFHSGDLNFWAWPSNDSKTMKKEYDDLMIEIDKIKRNPIDIAFFPVDYRLEENYAKGAEIFIDECKPQLFIPIHSGGYEKIYKKFVKEHHYADTFISPFYERNHTISIGVDIV